MGRCVFFSFHYQNDIWRVNVVRNSHIVEGCAAAGFTDGSIWEEAKRKGDDAVHALINRGLEGTTVTVVLIGSETANRKYVKYEIDRSIERGNGLLGIYIHNIKDTYGYPCTQGENPFDRLTWTKNSRTLSTTYRSYDWVNNSGYVNFGQWVEDAAKAAGR
jgi:hypothetical protein